MRIPGRRRVRAGLRWLRSRGRDRALILGYHRVTEDPDDPYRIAVRPTEFEGHLEMVRRYGTPVSLVELAGALSEGRPLHRGVAVTFDDGYVDVLESAKPLLESFAVPATVFVVSGAIGQPFWWDVLAGMLRRTRVRKRIKIQLDGVDTLDIQVDADQGSHTPLSLLHGWLQSMPQAMRQRAISALGRELGAPPAPTLPHRAMRQDELKRLVAGGLVTVGSHSVTHPQLTAQEDPARRREIEESRVELEQTVGVPVTAFSYPHGAFTQGIAELVRQAGFTCACSSSTDMVTARSDPFSLPRFWAPSRATADMGQFLRRWLR